MVHRQGRSRDDVLIVDIGHDADDATGLGAHVDELHDRIGPEQATVQRVLRGEHPLREALADDHHAFGIAAVVVGEVSAGNHRNPERVEETG